jgi:LysM repeat protein
MAPLMAVAAVPRAHADRGGSLQRQHEPLALLNGRLDGDSDGGRARSSHERLHAGAEHAQDEEPAHDEHSSGLVHRVAQGETLSAIAAHYGVAMQQILDMNPDLKPDKIREGQSLSIGGERRSLRYTIQPGDTLSRVAKNNDVTLTELKRWNPKLDPDHIRVGQELAVYPKKPASLSESVGTPAKGQLVHPRMLPPGAGYFVRAPERSWATDETVRGIIEAFQHLLKVDPRAPKIEVHDLSLRRGGPMTEHKSHQSGRDADIAYPQKHCDGVCDFRRLAPSDLDPARAFALLKYWLEQDMLEAVFVDYRLQAPLYQYARSQGATAEQLHRWFQYPNGRDYPLGVIRHFPKHDDHMHVRFNCHSSDPECKTYRPLLAHSTPR